MDEHRNELLESSQTSQIQTDNVPPPDSNKKKGSAKKVIAIIFLLILIALGIFRLIQFRMDRPQPEQKNPVNVAVTHAAISNIQVTTPLTATVQAHNQVSLSATLQAKVTDVYVSVGDHVAAGTPLFSLDSTQVQSAATQAEVALNQAQTNLNSAKANWDRMTALYDDGAIPKVQLDQAQDAYHNALSMVNQAQASVSSAEDNLENGTVTTPISGYVTELNVKKGMFPPPGVAAATVTDTSNLEIKTNVSEYLISKICVGQPVSVMIKSLSDQPFSGKIKTISPAPSAQSFTYPITVALNGKHHGVMAGMFAEVEIVSDHRENVVCIPSNSVLVKGGQTQVVVLDEKQIPTFQPVETGLDNGTLVEIKSGLKPNDIVVIQGQNYVIAGEAVHIVTPAKE